MMESSTAQDRLFRSCEILFGSDITMSREFLDYLQLNGLKKAYRIRVMETHPDRVASLRQVMEKPKKNSFHAVQDTYKELLNFLNAKNKGPQWVEFRNSERAASGPWQTTSTSHVRPPREKEGSSVHHHRQGPFSHQIIRPIILPGGERRDKVYTNIEGLYKGSLPYRRLLFGHFLYYSGLANWRTIARVLIWQRIERPRLGELGRRLSIFKNEDISQILQNKVLFQPFGQTARRLGIVTENQLQVLIFQQQRLQKKFGTILVEKDLINQHDLQELLFTFQDHNAGIRPQQ